MLSKSLPRPPNPEDDPAADIYSVSDSQSVSRQPEEKALDQKYTSIQMMDFDDRSDIPEEIESVTPSNRN